MVTKGAQAIKPPAADKNHWSPDAATVTQTRGMVTKGAQLTKRGSRLDLVSGGGAARNPGSSRPSGTPGCYLTPTQDKSIRSRLVGFTRGPGRKDSG